MKLGAYTACLHNLTLPEALDFLKSTGLTGARFEPSFDHEL